jgi:acetyl esterase/lipase
MVTSDVLARTPPPSGQILRYGKEPFQFAEFRYPPGEGPFPLLFVIHGGFWSAAYDLMHIRHLCSELSAHGVVTCSLEYRRIGNPGGGWPGTFLDVSDAVEYFRGRMSQDPRIDLKRAGVIGHSAGGHLALWLGGAHRISKDSDLYRGQKPWLRVVISLAGVADLRAGWRANLGGGAVGRLIGGSPEKYPKRYLDCSPIELLPMGLRQILIHGRMDATVPIAQSEAFVQRAKAAGDDVSLVSLDKVGHFELIDPESHAWNAVASPSLAALGVE